MSQKSPIFIVHGWSYDSSKWQPIIEELKSIGYKVELLKVPGLTGDKLKQAWTIDDYVNWLKDSVGTTPAIFIGHSNGGRIIMNLAVKHPKLVEQIILIDAAGVPRNELSLRIKRSIFKVTAKAGKAVTKNEKARRILYKLSRTQDYRDASPVMRQTMANLLKSDDLLDATKISAPTNLIWGEDDAMTPLKDGYLLESQIKNASLKVIKDARHSPQFTKTSEVMSEIKKVLNGRI